MRSITAGFVTVCLMALLVAPAYADKPDYSVAGMASGDIYFGTMSYELTDDARSTLKELADWIKKRPGSMTLLAGYDDQRTAEDESMALASQRTKAVRDYLIKLGADGEAIKAISFGNTRVANPGQGEAVWSKNRRVRYRVVVAQNSDKMEGKPSGVCQRCKK